MVQLVLVRFSFPQSTLLHLVSLVTCSFRVWCFRLGDNFSQETIPNTTTLGTVSPSCSAGALDASKRWAFVGQSECHSKKVRMKRRTWPGHGPTMSHPSEWTSFTWRDHRSYAIFWPPETKWQGPDENLGQAAGSPHTQSPAHSS